MNIPLVTALLTSLGVLPFTAGVVLATWRQRRAVARRSRDLTIEIGPKVLLGVALTGVGATPVMAAATPASSTSAPTWLPVLDRGPVLAVPTSSPESSVAPSTQPNTTPDRRPSAPGSHHRGGRPNRPESQTHVVQPGESLWSITAQHLGPHATISNIAAAWPRLFEVNRAVIGSNPRLVLPGQHLALPADFGQDGS